MEPFIDGGLFEVLIALALGSLINYIFFKKYLLILYSACSVLSPVVLALIPKGPLFYCIASLCFLNSIVLIMLLWREKKKHPEGALFDIKKFKR